MFKFAVAHQVLGSAILKVAPPEWQEIILTLERDKIYHGVGNSYTNEFTFSFDGYFFLKSIYESYGVEAVAHLIVYSFTPETNSYDTIIYAGKFNFSKYLEVQDAGEYKIKIAATESGFMRNIINLDDVEVNLQSLESLQGEVIQEFDNELQEIQLHSKAIIKKYRAKPTATQPIFQFRPLSNNSEKKATLYIGFDDVIINELNAYTYATGLLINDDRIETIEFVERGPITVTYNVDVLVQCLRHVGDFDKAYLSFYIGINGQDERIFAYDSNPGGRVNGTFSRRIQCSGTRNYNVNIGDKLYFYGTVEISDVSGNVFGNYEFEWRVDADPSCSINVFAETTTNSTPARVMLAHEYLSRICQSLTGKPVPLYSELYGRTDSQPVSYAADGEGALRCITNGAQIRQFPIAERPIFGSFKKAFESLDTYDNIGIGSEFTDDGEEYLRVEKKSHFYRNEIILELGEVRNLRISPAIEYNYTQVEFGFKKWQTNEDNSLDEFNTKNTRVLPTISSKNKFARTSEFTGSGYSIEQSRRLEYKDTSTKEDSADKDNFIICLLRQGGGYKPQRNEGIETRNIISPGTAYNIAISPTRNLKRWGYFLRAGLKHHTDEYFKFQEGQANYTFASKFASETVETAEDESILISDLEPPIFTAEYYEFDTTLAAFQWKLLQANPYGIITFINQKGTICSGFIVSVEYKPYDQDATIKLLRSNY